MMAVAVAMAMIMTAVAVIMADVVRGVAVVVRHWPPLRFRPDEVQ